MLHGPGPEASGWANFNRNIQPLTNTGCRVILIDCPSCRKSDTIISDGSRSYLNTRVLNGLIDALGLNQIDIIGNSMGGHSAVTFALD
jgi:2-hydroxy-6-oxonona-2,4-dienedioate hydrolase